MDQVLLQLSLEKPFVANSESYAELLEVNGIAYTDFDDIHYLIGKPEREQGWILNISVIQTQALDLLKILVPFLVQAGVPFKIPKNREKISDLSSPKVEFIKLGKAITVYPKDDQSVVELAKQLVTLTKRFRGPFIPTDFHLGGSVYARYSAINPVIVVNALGQHESFIHGPNQELIKDVVYVPFKKPDHVSWPFDIAINAMDESIGNMVGGKFLLLGTLKDDIKGHVYKAIGFVRFWPQICVVKEGKHDLCVDDQGRDIQDRLRWQYEVMTAIQEVIPSPKVFSLFSQYNDTFLVMEFIKGVTLREKIIDVYQGRAWADLANSDRVNLISWILQIIDIISVLHNKGFIHRDVTPANFMVNKRGKVIVIDLELTYSTDRQYPSPPFKSGTPGYMSNNQAILGTPSIEDDIFGLGAMLIKVFTSLGPMKFMGLYEPQTLIQNLSFFTQDVRIAKVIAASISPAPNKRPVIDKIKYEIKAFQDRLLEGQRDKQSKVTADLLLAKSVLCQGTQTVINLLVRMPGDIQYIHAEKIVPAVNAYERGVMMGLAGSLLFLKRVKDINLDVVDVESAISANATVLFSEKNLLLDKRGWGYFDGLGGIEYTLHNLSNGGLLSKTTVWYENELFDSSQELLDIAYGISGIGLLIIRSLRLEKNESGKKVLERYVNVVVERQALDGSWAMIQGYKFTGFCFGNAGVLYFLLNYLEVNPSESVRASVIRGLAWLNKQSKSINGNLLWSVSEGNNITNAWFDEGSLGIVLCLIKAYEVIGDHDYKSLALGTLRSYPNKFLDGGYSFINGLSGLGEVYLEAYRVFGEEEFRTRASWICDVFTHSCVFDGGGNLLWNVENNSSPTFDFAGGTIGILHFLLRFCHPNKIDFFI